jgi:hypothetical protein
MHGGRNGGLLGLGGWALMHRLSGVGGDTSGRRICANSGGCWISVRAGDPMPRHESIEPRSLGGVGAVHNPCDAPVRGGRDVLLGDVDEHLFARPQVIEVANPEPATGDRHDWLMTEPDLIEELAAQLRPRTIASDHLMSADMAVTADLVHAVGVEQTMDGVKVVGVQRVRQ